MTLSLANITFDCDDTLAVSAFWSAALGMPVDDGAMDGFATLGYPARDGRPAWLFIKVPEGKTAKNRVHIDLTSPDRAAEVARLVELGATQVGEHHEYGHEWTVMNDPEGNEFCIASA